MFGKFMYGMENMIKPSEAITKKLRDPNTTLEDLLKEDELLQELRNQNKDLLKFFDKEKVKQMLNYITKEQEDQQEKGYKFPYLCSQIFGLELENIMKFFFITNKEMEESQKKENNDIKNNEEKKEENKDNEKIKNEENIDNDNKEIKEEDKNKNEESDNKEVKTEDNKISEEKKDEVKEEKTEQSKELEKSENKEEIKDENIKEEKEENKEEKKEENKEEPKDNEKKEEEPKEEKDEEPKKEKDEENKEENNEGNNEDNNEENEEEQESTENKIEVLDYFFNNFFPEEESIKLNYVLSGYFSSLINNLLAFNPNAFLKYIYLERSEFLNKMVEHCYRKSISDTLSKILHYENYIQNAESFDDKTKEDMSDTRKYLLSDIFEHIDIDMENENLNSIYFFITGLFDITNIQEERQIFEEIINNKKIIKSIITKPFHNLNLLTDDDYEKLLNRRKNFSTLVDMILFFLTNSKKLKLEIPTNTSGSKLTIKHTKISDEIFTVLKALLQNNFIKKNENEEPQLQSFNDYQLKPLGEYKNKILDLLTHLVPYFKNISKFYDEILIEIEFFKYAFDFLIEYEWNNLYQESLLNLLKSLLNYADEHQDLQKYLIENIKIFDLIQKYTTLDTLEKFKFTNTKENDLKEEERITLPINHGYYSFFISLSYKLNTVLGGTPVNIDGGIPRQGSFFFMKRVPEEGDKKAALDMLYGGLGDDKEEKKEEEEPDNFCFECMKEFMNDQWREFFGMNIESIIKQYEDKNWPKQEKKPFDSALDNPGDGNEDLLNSGDNDRDKNIFGDNNDGDMLGNFEDDGKDERRGGVFEAEKGNEDEEQNPFYNAVKEDNFDFENENENKERVNVGGDEDKKDENNNNNFANENEFEFDEEHKEKDKDKEENIINEEKGEEKAEAEKEENKEVKTDENKEEKEDGNKEEKTEPITEEKTEVKEGENKEVKTEDNPEVKAEESKEEKTEENKEIKKEEGDNKNNEGQDADKKPE